MKKWAWMFVLPYVVVITDTSPYHVADFSSIGCGTTDYELTPPGFFCQSGEGKSCDWIYDLAESLNAAHERRTQPVMGIPPCGNHDPGEFAHGCYVTPRPTQSE